MESLIATARCLADPLGLRVFMLLHGRFLTMKTLCRVFDLPRSALNPRLESLRAARLVEAHTRESALLFSLSEEGALLYRDLVERFGDELNWDPLLAEDRARVGRATTASDTSRKAGSTYSPEDPPASRRSTS